ncbi:MAG: sensor domain-containing diguanylate cyclase [Thiohalocapsa sp.]|nr:sensor domain-containing diguanylate cyclase [Thiohalocapsa sp.]
MRHHRQERPDAAASGPIASPAGIGWGELGEAVQLLDLGRDALLCLDEQGRVVLSNRGAERIFGLGRSDMRGRRWDSLVTEAVPDALSRALEALDADSGLRTVSLDALGLHGRRWDGTEFPLEGSVSTLQLGGLRGHALLLRDISARIDAETRLRFLAHHDTLTGLPNRALLMDRLDSAVKRHRRQNESFALVFIDLDGLKAINDTQGHLAGDSALRGVADRLRQVLRASDTAARMSGDEFVAILQHIGDAAAARQAVERIGAYLEHAPVVFDGTPLDLRVSLGLALFPTDGGEPLTLLRHADEAMYRTKRARKACKERPA